MSSRVRSELSRLDAFFPILSGLGNRWAATRPWEGMTVGLHLHLTSITAGLVRELVLGGGRWVLSAANPATTARMVIPSGRCMKREPPSVWCPSPGDFDCLA